MITAAVIGSGFIGAVHLEALRRIGVPVAGLLGSSAARGAERAAALGLPKAWPDLGALLADRQVDVVHVTSPNALHFPQVMAILAAGKHVICEKPLAMTPAQSAEMVRAARSSGRIAAVCYNTRFYPLNQHMRGMIAAGELGDIHLVTGSYHQDWLARPGDWNWRLDRAEGGELRSVGDIGTHWMDLTSFITGLPVASVMAELVTIHKRRERPKGPVETFAAAAGETVSTEIETDDAATILIRFQGGARGMLSTSQISFGRKNALTWEIAGSKAAASWHSETPDHLWIGHRDRPNELLQRDGALMNAAGSGAARLPAGHVEGFADTFAALFRAVYADIAAGARRPLAGWASFDDGHREILFCEAVLASSRTGRWTDLPSS
jgi:predicted dehydrogenase